MLAMVYDDAMWGVIEWCSTYIILFNELIPQHKGYGMYALTSG